MDAIPSKLNDVTSSDHTYSDHACSELSLDDLEIWVHLGCTEEERATPQPILLSVALRFATTPRACETDALADTVCYSEMAATARDVCAAREFHTVESLAWDLGRALRERLEDTTRLTVRLAKPRAPVPGLRGGVTFTIDA